MTIRFEVEIGDDTAQHLTATLAAAHKDPRVDAKTGHTIIEKRYALGTEVEQWVTEVVSANIAKTLAQNPTPAMVEHRRLVAESEERVRTSLAHSVKADLSQPATPTE